MFNDKELEFIKKVMDKYDWWENKKISEKIQDYFNEIKEVAECNHEYGKYTIKHTRCKKCGKIDYSKGESETLKGSGF